MLDQFSFNGAENTYLVQKQVIESRQIPLMFAYDVIHGFRTMFPIPLAESCSWDLELMEKTAKIAAAEASAPDFIGPLPQWWMFQEMLVGEE